MNKKVQAQISLHQISLYENKFNKIVDNFVTNSPSFSIHIQIIAEENFYFPACQLIYKNQSNTECYNFLKQNSDLTFFKDIFNYLLIPLGFILVSREEKEEIY